MKAIVSLSGGMDSATVLAECLDRGREVEAVGFCYGSKHNQYENQAARDLAEHYAVPFRLIDFSSVASHFQSALLKSGGDIPEGHYEEELMKRTVVPGRNLVFISILTTISTALCSTVPSLTVPRHLPPPGLKPGAGPIESPALLPIWSGPLAY